MGDNIYSNYNAQVEDRLRVLDTFMVKDENNNLKYVVHYLEKRLNDNSVVKFYKASAFFRLTRVSKMAKENKLFMETHTDIIRAMYNANVNFIEIIANVLTPTPYGLIFLYGVQSVGNTKEEAIRKCSCDFSILTSAFQGTHRTIHIAPISNEIVLISLSDSLLLLYGNATEFVY